MDNQYKFDEIADIFTGIRVKRYQKGETKPQKVLKKTYEGSSQFEIEFQNVSEDINPKFYQYVLMSYESKGILKRISNGVTIKHLTGTTLSFMPVPIPPVAEQLRIIAAIESLFAQLDTIAESLN